MHTSLVRGSKLQLVALSGAIALALVAGSAQAQITQSGERKNINRLGHTDLQGRSSYQPSAIQYPDGRWILFAGLHNTIPVQRPPCRRHSAESAERQRLRGQRHDDHRRHRSGESVRDVPHSGDAWRPVDHGARVPGFRAAWRPGEQRLYHPRRSGRCLRRV